MSLFETFCFFAPLNFLGILSLFIFEQLAYYQPNFFTKYRRSIWKMICELSFRIEAVITKDGSYILNKHELQKWHVEKFVEISVLFRYSLGNKVQEKSYLTRARHVYIYNMQQNRYFGYLYTYTYRVRQAFFMSDSISHWLMQQEMRKCLTYSNTP